MTNTPAQKPPPWTAPATPPGAIDGLGLRLRHYTPADAESLFAAIDASRDSLLPWLPWAGFSHADVAASRADIDLFARTALTPCDPAHRALGYVRGVFDLESGSLLGGTGFNCINAATATAETGYWLRADVRGRGVITRATRLNISHGFAPQAEGGYGFRRIVIYASTANERSCRVPDRIGLRRELHARNDRWVDRLGWTDTLGWAVLAEEWDRENHTLR